MENKSFVVLITLLLWVFYPLANSSYHAQHIEQRPITINTDLVTTWVQVTNRIDGSPVKELDLSAFQLQEEGKQQKISLVKQGQPLSVVILVDGYNCLTEPWYHRSEFILYQLGEDAEIALMAWDSDAVLVQPFSKDQYTVIDKFSKRYNFFSALNPGPYGIEPLFGTKINVRPERNDRRPSEAIYHAAKYLEKAASPEYRKVIIVISQANIEIAYKHQHTASEVETLLEKTSTTVYGLVHGNEPGDVGKVFKTLLNPKRELKGTFSGRLNDFVDFTGGTTLVGKWEECDDMFIKLTQMIRSSYTIGYYPENTNFDGKFRRIKLELSKSGKAKFGNVKITTRDGYHAIRRATPTVAETNVKQ